MTWNLIPLQSYIRTNIFEIILPGGTVNTTCFTWKTKGKFHVTPYTYLIGGYEVVFDSAGRISAVATLGVPAVAGYVAWYF